MFRKNGIIDTFLPDYRRRHIFTTKLRILAFVGFWSFFLFFFKDVLPQVKVVSGIVFACFISTGFAYYNIMRSRWLVFSFLIELFSDLISITSVLYLTGGPYSTYFTMYLFYVFAAGAIYNHYLSGAAAIAAAIVYGSFILMCQSGAIPPLILDYGDSIPIQGYTPHAHFVIAAIFLAVVVYTVKVAIYFSQERERELEKRNRELLALHRVSSAVRSVAVLKEVIDSLLCGVMDGLNFETVVLIRFDKDRGLATLFTPRKHKKLREIESLLGRSLEGLAIPLSKLHGSAFADIMKQKIIFRKNLSEIVGPDGMLSIEQCDQIQRMVGAKRLVAMPLVLGDFVMGVMIGFAREAFLEDTQVAALESFANQTAMSLQAAVMIDRLRTINQELKRANEVKSEFLATMSHELRTPLTAIIGFSELLIEGVMGDLTKEQSESLEEVLHNAADLLDLINGLLDLTKMESGKIILDKTLFDISSAVKRACGTIAPLVHKKGQKLDVKFCDGVCKLLGDEKKIQQVMLNLLANANKFTDRKGSIEVSIRQFLSPKDPICEAFVNKFEGISQNFTKGGIVVTVSDNGIGVPVEQQERIFEMFHQADGSITRSFGGTGLGLALARKFIELHGGHIWVESELGMGAKFTFLLPINPANA